MLDLPFVQSPCHGRFHGGSIETRENTGDEGSVRVRGRFKMLPSGPEKRVIDPRSEGYHVPLCGELALERYQIGKGWNVLASLQGRVNGKPFRPYGAELLFPLFRASLPGVESLPPTGVI